MMSPAPTLLTTREAADYLRCSVTTLRKYVREGRVKPERLGPKLLRFDPRDLDRVLR